MTNPFRLDGQVAIVTGSSRGIGRAIAETMASLGARVVVSSRKPKPCDEVVEAIGAAGGEAIAVPCNVSEKADIEVLVGRTLETWGKVDCVVCNAAVNPVAGPLSALTDEAFDKIMDANVKSNLWLCNLTIPGMAERGGGSVVLVSSIAGFRGSPTIAAYGISKAASMSLARSLAVEWGPKNVRVNCLAPGLIKTDFARALWENPDFVNPRIAATPLRRIGSPEEMGPIAAFLASPAASFITGQAIVADGGLTIS